MKKEKHRVDNIYNSITKMPGIIAFWDFSESRGQERVSSAGNKIYRLYEAVKAIERIDEGPISGYSAELTKDHYFKIPRQDLNRLDIHGHDSQVSIIAWIKRGKKPDGRPSEFIAGIWYEAGGGYDLKGKRQYALFLNMGWQHEPGPGRVTPHISAEGGPSPGLKWCYDYAISKSAVPLDEWSTVGFTYDSRNIRAYFNGLFSQLPNNDFREGIEYLKGNSLNPYHHDRGIFNAGKDGVGFTIGARTHDPNQTPAYFHGLIGGLVVFNRALSAEEMRLLGEK